jgi:hypothetical protein
MVASGRALGGCRGLGLAAKEAFQPADETDGFLFRFGARRAFRLRLRAARLELAIIASRFARLEAARFPCIARVTRLPRLVGTTFALIAAATFAAVTRLESPTFLGPLRRFCRGTGCAAGFPTHGGPPGIFRR